MLASVFYRLRKPNDSRHIFRTGPQSHLLSAAIALRLKSHLVRNIERTHAFWSIDLGSIQCQKIHSKPRHIDTKKIQRLGSIRMKIKWFFDSPRQTLKPYLADNRRNLRKWLNRPKFIVCERHRNQHSIISNLGL